MSSPPPIDPYFALGIPKDADVSTIRRAHRTLVLKFHPDRIRDAEERERGREEFQKVQQAYELLSDPAKRSRYDDKMRLAELRKESLGRNLPPRSTTYPNNAPSFTTTAREYKDGYYYEERVPREAAFFEDEDRFREEPARQASRKADTYVRKSSAGYTEKKSGSSWAAGEISIDIGLRMQRSAARAKEKVKERERDRTAAAKSRDQERRRDTSDKQNSRRPYAEDVSNSDSDTVTYSNHNRKATKVSSSSTMPHRSKSDQTRPREPKYSEDDNDDDWSTSRDKHQGLHASASNYIQQSQQVKRQDSSHSYFEPRDDRSYYARRGESDWEERREHRDRPKYSRRPSISEVERGLRSRTMPSIPTANSAPANLKNPHRSSTTQAVRDHRKEIPSMPPRSNTMPSAGSARRTENAPSRGSNLKYAETQDSGYSSSSPATPPDMHGTSPPRYPSATRYQIVPEAEEYNRGHRTILVEAEDSNYRMRSPSRERRPSLATSGNKHPSRAATAYTPRSPAEKGAARPSLSRHERSRSSTQPRESAHFSRGSSSQRERKNLYREMSSDEHDGSYKHRVANEKVTSPRSRGQDAKYTAFFSRGTRDGGRDEDHYPGSHYVPELRHPGMGTRGPSVC